MGDDKSTKLKQTREYFLKWIDRNQKAQEVLPLLHDSLDLLDWTIEAVEQCPEQRKEQMLDDLGDQLDDSVNHWIQRLPMIPSYDKNAIVAASTLLSGGSNSAYVCVSEMADSDVPEIKGYSNFFSTAYRSLQEKHGRTEKVRNLIQSLDNHNTLERFDRAINAWTAAKSGTGERASVATEMRTLLDGVKGVLFEKARAHQGENMTWKEMAKRLSKESETGAEEQALVDEDRKRSILLNKLSTVLKYREGETLTDIDNLCAMVLDHLYIVLQLIDREKLTQPNS